MPSVTVHRAFRLAGATLAALLAAAPAISQQSAGDAAPASSAAVLIDGNAVALESILEPVAGELLTRERQYLVARTALEFKYREARERIIVERLNKFLDDEVLGRAAREQHTTAESLLAAVQAAPVTETEAQRTYDQFKSQVAEPFPAVKDQILRLLAEQNATSARRAYLDALRDKYHASIEREPMRTPVAASGPARGPADARVTLVEFADFQCPFCARLETDLRRLLAAYPTQVRLVFRHLPLSRLHPFADGAARSAVCAGRQQRFWELHDWMYAHQDRLQFDALRDVAPSLGLDGARFAECLENGHPEQAVQADANAASDIGLTSTPALFVNGRFVDGAVPYGELAALVAAELGRAAGRRADAGGR